MLNRRYLWSSRRSRTRRLVLEVLEDGDDALVSCALVKVEHGEDAADVPFRDRDATCTRSLICSFVSPVAMSESSVSRRRCCGSGKGLTLLTQRPKVRASLIALMPALQPLQLTRTRNLGLDRQAHIRCRALFVLLVRNRPYSG